MLIQLPPGSDWTAPATLAADTAIQLRAGAGVLIALEPPGGDEDGMMLRMGPPAVLSAGQTYQLRPVGSMAVTLYLGPLA